MKNIRNIFSKLGDILSIISYILVEIAYAFSIGAIIIATIFAYFSINFPDSDD